MCPVVRKQAAHRGQMLTDREPHPAVPKDFALAVAAAMGFCNYHSIEYGSHPRACSSPRTSLPGFLASHQTELRSSLPEGPLA